MFGTQTKEGLHILPKNSSTQNQTDTKAIQAKKALAFKNSKLYIENQMFTPPNLTIVEYL